MKTLKLTLKKEWFDLIEKGIKTEEYRELKAYWERRLYETPFIEKHFDLVEFTNGYSPKSPQITLEFLGLEIGKGNPKLGAICI